MDEIRSHFEVVRIPDPIRELDKPFLMPVENSFSISGRGTVVTGKVKLHNRLLNLNSYSPFFLFENFCREVFQSFATARSSLLN